MYLNKIAGDLIVGGRSFRNLCLWQWFLEHDEEGIERVHPYDGNMVTAQAGVDVAVRFIQWVGLNFPGHDWPKKATELVSPFKAKKVAHLS